MAHEMTRSGGRATAVSVRCWQVSSSAEVGQDGRLISSPGYRATRWYQAPARSTAMAALLANGRYPAVEYSTNLRDLVDATDFEVPWWFRTVFTASPRDRTVLQADGVIPKADLWVNGTMVAGSDVIAGAYTTNCFDVSSLVGEGLNVAAFLVHPGNPNTDLSIGWVDWNQWPPDNNMGIWRDVWIRHTGAVSLAHLRVTSELADDLASASLEVSVDVTNRSESAVTALVSLAIAGPKAAETVAPRETVSPRDTVAPRETVAPQENDARQRTEAAQDADAQQVELEPGETRR
ncbi:MAG TPA: hypothetical protein VGP46_08355, partial [Acidimicrobiales bacterium]|nr:hypothetical protein [Acidimicrobiales bacterium]